MITFKEFKRFCNERAADGCWNMESAITLIQIYDDCNSVSIFPRKKNKYFQEHYGEAMTKFVSDTYSEMKAKGFVQV